MRNEKCQCPVCQVIRHGVTPVMPAPFPDPRAMEAGDCQRVLIEAWDAMQDAERG